MNCLRKVINIPERNVFYAEKGLHGFEKKISSLGNPLLLEILFYPCLIVSIKQRTLSGSVSG